LSRVSVKGEWSVSAAEAAHRPANLARETSAELGGPLQDLVDLGTSRASSGESSSAQWSAKGQNGPHTVEVAVDPANTIPELDETNNSATKTFTVQGGKAQ
jgi:hypothetical protein